MGHVVRMTMTMTGAMTGAMGITFVVDAANLIWILQPGDPRLMAAIGFALVIQASVAALIVGFRHQILAVSGASGETAALAARYLAITMPSLSLMAISMIANGALRAEGDGCWSMFVILTSGAVVMMVDPVLIVGLEWG